MEEDVIADLTYPCKVPFADMNYQHKITFSDICGADLLGADIKNVIKEA